MNLYTVRNLIQGLVFTFEAESFPEWKLEWGSPGDCEVEELENIDKLNLTEVRLKLTLRTTP